MSRKSKKDKKHKKDEKAEETLLTQGDQPEMPTDDKPQKLSNAEPDGHGVLQALV